MRALAIGMGILTLLPLVGGCSEEFSPKSEFRAHPIVYATASITETPLPPSQRSISAVVMRSFDVAGTNPAGSTIDPSVRGATVRVSRMGTVQTLVERRRSSIDSLTGIGPRWYYAASTFSASPGDTLLLTIDLPGGGTVSARTRIPVRRHLRTNPQYELGVTTHVDPTVEGTAWVFDWEAAPGDQHLFFPSLTLAYLYRSDSGMVQKTLAVPASIVRSGEASVPVYPRSTTTSRLEVGFDALDWAMLKISEGDPEKARYTALLFRWQLTEFDFALSRYYASVNGYLDAYSVRIDETVYSNISGGIGVFGSTFGVTVEYPVSKSYGARFGYDQP